MAMIHPICVDLRPEIVRSIVKTNIYKILSESENNGTDK